MCGRRKLGHVGADFGQYAGRRIRFNSRYCLEQFELLLVRLELAQNLCIEVAYLRFQKVHVGQTLTNQKSMMVAQAMTFQRCDDFRNLSLQRSPSKLCDLLGCWVAF